MAFNIRTAKEMIERFNCMKNLEVTTYKRPLSLSEPFQGLWRQRIVEWMHSITHHCDLRHEAASAATYFLDTSVSKGMVQSPADYQLVAMTAFHIALKIYDSPSTRLVKLSSLVKLGNGEFDEKDVNKMECKILFLLQWRVNPPTPICFLNQYLALLPEDTNPTTVSKIEEHSLKVIETAICREFYSWMDSSVLAYAAMLLTFERMNQVEMSVSQLRQFLSNMAELTKLESNNHTLVRYTILLDRTMRDPNNLSTKKGLPESVYEQQYKLGEMTAIHDCQSPNSVAME
jgi:hypothetical protein